MFEYSVASCQLRGKSHSANPGRSFGFGNMFVPPVKRPLINKKLVQRRESSVLARMMILIDSFMILNTLPAVVQPKRRAATHRVAAKIILCR